jgi:hypothetical protein
MGVPKLTMMDDAVVLGCAVLWYAFTAEGIADKPLTLYQQIHNAPQQ